MPPDQPSPESVKLTESTVLIEFIADLSPPGRLLPLHPVERAKARRFIHQFGELYIPAWKGVVYDGRDPSEFLTVLEKLQSLLPEEGYAIGQWSIADAAVAPFLPRLKIYLTLDDGPATAVWNAFETDLKFARLRRYYQDVTRRESFVKTFDKVRFQEVFFSIDKLTLDIRNKSPKRSGRELPAWPVNKERNGQKAYTKVTFCTCNYIRRCLAKV